MTRRAFLKTAVSGAAALSVLGCTMAVPPPRAPTPTVGPSTTASDIVVGVILSLSGRYSREGALIRAGYETWLDAVQQAGGIKIGAATRTVRLNFADDESEPLIAGRQAERLASVEKVMLWLGPFSSA